MSTTRTDRWKEEVRTQLDERGSRADLARYLCEGDPSGFAGRKVQIARVLNQGAIPEAEFVLAVQEWLASRKRRNQMARRSSQ